MKNSKILIVANAESPLLVDRVAMAFDGPAEVVWYSESSVPPRADCRCYHYRIRPWLGLLNKVFSALFFLFVYLKERPDILHVHWALFFPLLFKPSWKNLVVSVMGSDVNLPGRFQSRRFFNRVAFTRASAITSKSSPMDQAINRTGDYSEKIRRFTWGVEDRFFNAGGRRQQARRQWGIPDDAVVFFSPRSLQPLYRVPDIVKAFRSLADGNPRLYLLVAGMNALEVVNGQIDEVLTGASCADRVIRLQRLDKQGMIDCYAASDSVVSYAMHDGMPQSLYEAMAVGCFPLFTELPCYDELLEQGRNALLIDTNDSTSVQKKMAEYLEITEADLKTVVDGNRALIKGIASKEVERKKLHELYQQLLISSGR